VFCFELADTPVRLFAEFFLRSLPQDRLAMHPVDKPKEPSLTQVLTSVQAIGTQLAAMQGSVAVLQGTVAEQGEFMRALQGTVAEQGEFMRALQGTVAEQYGNMQAAMGSLNFRLADLQTSRYVREALDDIDDYWEPPSHLHSSQ
jgi:hypothetical protein